MLENKTKYTIEIATQISKKEDKNIPDLIKKLFDLIYPKEDQEGDE
jgi:endonuclease III